MAIKVTVYGCKDIPDLQELHGRPAMKRAARFSITIPSDPAKNASTCVMKYRSLSA